MTTGRHHAGLSSSMQAQLEKASSARPEARKKRVSPKPSPAKVPKAKVVKAARKESVGKVAIQAATPSASELKLPAIVQPKPKPATGEASTKLEPSLQLPSIVATPPGVAAPPLRAAPVADDRSQQQKVSRLPCVSPLILLRPFCFLHRFSHAQRCCYRSEQNVLVFTTSAPRLTPQRSFNAFSGVGRCRSRLQRSASTRSPPLSAPTNLCP